MLLGEGIWVGVCGTVVNLLVMKWDLGVKSTIL